MGVHSGSKIRIVRSSVGQEPTAIQPRVELSPVVKLKYHWERKHPYTSNVDTHFDYVYPGFMKDLARMRECNGDRLKPQRNVMEGDASELYEAPLKTIIYDGVPLKIGFFFVWYGEHEVPGFGIASEDGNDSLVVLDDADSNDILGLPNKSGRLTFYSECEEMSSAMKKILDQMRLHKGQVKL